MKYLTLIIGLLLIICNLLFGLILSSYPSFNMWLNCIIIAVTSYLLYALNKLQMRDAYYIALYTLFSISGFIEFVLGLLSPDRLTDNIPLIIIICLFIFKLIFILITNFMSNLIKG